MHNVHHRIYSFGCTTLRTLTFSRFQMLFLQLKLILDLVTWFFLFSSSLRAFILGFLLDLIFVTLSSFKRKNLTFALLYLYKCLKYPVRLVFSDFLYFFHSKNVRGVSRSCNASIFFSLTPAYHFCRTFRIFLGHHFLFRFFFYDNNHPFFSCDIFSGKSILEVLNNCV